MKRLTIGKNDAGQRLDKFLAKAVPLLPRALMYKYIRTKRVKLAGRRCESAQKLVEGDILELYISDEFFADAELPFLAAPALLSVVYEDENLLLIDKPPGLLVHEDDTNEPDTLIRRVQHYLYEKGEYDPLAEQGFSPALCNRIDRNTGGIVIAAKNFPTLQLLSEKIKNREVTKRYLCLCCGVPSLREATLRGFHTKDAASNTVKITREERPGAKTALTRYRVLRDNGRNSLVEVELLTGRTHQIRAHMASIGCPLLGDTKYGHRLVKGTGRSFQALYSYQLTFDFEPPSGHLDYLSGKTFQVQSVPFDLEG